ncbi:hypothetical protein HYV86_04260 [Candidatus Woesearchaeota archaeon]|nr:hypothetical protein [Candidatus Woesearchaeota archaeon]
MAKLQEALIIGGFAVATYAGIVGAQYVGTTAAVYTREILYGRNDAVETATNAIARVDKVEGNWFFLAGTNAAVQHYLDSDL